MKLGRFFAVVIAAAYLMGTTVAVLATHAGTWPDVNKALPQANMSPDEWIDSGSSANAAYRLEVRDYLLSHDFIPSKASEFATTIASSEPISRERWWMYTFPNAWIQYRDPDKDTVPAQTDNCPLRANTTQNDTDGDGIGDACEDADGDTIMDAVDNCPSVSNLSQQNSDPDTLGNACDNCPIVTNLDQADDDGDKIGNACEIIPTSVPSGTTPSTSTSATGMGATISMPDRLSIPTLRSLGIPGFNLYDPAGKPVLKDPAGDTGIQKIVSLIAEISGWLLSLLTALGIIMFIVAGYMFITAAGDDEKITKAKNIVRWVIIGLVVAMFSWTVIKLIVTATSTTSSYPEIPTATTAP